MAETRRRGFGQGGYRQRRKDRGLDLVILHLSVKPENYEWVDTVRKGLGVTKGEALDAILEQDRARVMKQAGA